MKTIITILRMAIGWHFLFEGITKFFAKNWTAQSYLLNTNSFLSGFYHWLATSPVRMEIVDFMNVYGLILIGIALCFGVFIRFASLSGVSLLVLYYFAYPPFGVSVLSGGYSNMYIVDMIFIEAVILLYLFFCKEKGYSIDYLIRWYTSRKQEKNEQPTTTMLTRRETLKNLVSAPVLALLGVGAHRTLKTFGADAFTGATVQINQMELSELKGELPKGKLVNLDVSRLILGGNMIIGSAHARDLRYASKLFRAYNTEKKVFETLLLAEKAGINAISTGVLWSLEMVAKYKRLTNSKIKMIFQTDIGEINRAIDLGAEALTVVGYLTDNCVRDNKMDIIVNMLNDIRSQGYPAGMAAHEIEALIACEENGVIPDYYMPTFHHDNYWSAHPFENRTRFEAVGRLSSDHNRYHDNLFCRNSDLSVEFIHRVKVPVIGYKILAGGAIDPKDGFNWAFQNGADFICVGMFDFQVVEDVNICIDTLAGLKNRKREWFA